MWMRFTARARDVILYAQEEATRCNRNSVEPEELLLGLVRNGETAVGQLLAGLGLTPDQIRAGLGRLQPAGPENRARDLPLAPRGKRIIDLAYEEARQANLNYIGTEQLLLALLLEGGGEAERVLQSLGVTPERVRQELEQIRLGSGQAHPSEEESRA